MQTALKLSSQAIIISHNFVLYKPQFSEFLFHSGKIIFNLYFNEQFTYFHLYSTPGRSFDVREPKDRLVSSREGEVFYHFGKDLFEF